MTKTNHPFSRYGVRHLYHFCDRRNLRKIKKLGGLYSSEKPDEMGIEIPAPGGNDWSREADKIKGIDHYIHLCFRDNHPMEHRAKEEGRIVDSIFLRIGLEVLNFDGVKYAPDVANKSGVAIHTLEEALESNMIDFEVLYRWQDWHDPTIHGRLALAEKCEILVPDHIPIALIRNFPDD